MAYDRVNSPSHQIIQADDDDLEALSFSHPSAAQASSSSAGVAAAGPSTAPGSGSQLNGGLSGKIGSGPTPGSTSRTGWGGVTIETRYTGESTLDEPVSATIMRDLRSIYAKLLQVVYPPKGGGSNELLRDWDLWGPLVICLSLAIILSVDAPTTQAMPVFSLVISLITIGSVVLTINCKLLGGKVSFFQSLCVLGYALAPILLASVISLLVHNLFVRIPISLACWAWSVWASMNFFNGTQLPETRIWLAVYPLCLFFFVLAWMIMIQ
ncbi:Yip1 domain-domain-containing protein [Kockovaella imperatae]|uniref:Protein YIP n=1 Tax=Kockovaella imperatae TaxID=4999 RepID=A0A1Y1ULU2_9TREE|nr:Yip1 domain-domain-containing protein [Kockovaella imperatae]ORX38497.1 Yip1 domain-domain-containing protein [Kockovaella imperatae]